MTLLTEKKTHNLKVASYVLSGDLIEDYNLQDSLSYNLRNSSKEVKEELGYIGVFAEKNTYSTSKDYS